MAIVLHCECGQKLKAKEEWRGTKVKCPSCGNVLLVPKNSAAEPPARSAPPSKPKPATVAQRNAEPDRPRTSRPSAPPPPPPPKPIKGSPGPEEDELDNVEEPRPRKLKRKKRKKASGGFQFPEFDFLGIHMTLRKWLAFIGAAAVVGFLAWLLIPRTSCSILECKFVDAYAALEVGDGEGTAGLEALAKRVLGGPPSAPTTPGDILSTGGNMFLVVRDAPQEGEAVLLHLHLPNGFLQDHADYVKGTFNIKDADFLLQGEGKPVKALLVDMEKKAAFLDKVSEVRINFFGQGSPNAVIPRERTPWFPQGKIEKNFEIANLYPEEQKGHRTQSKRDMGREPDNSITITGKGSFVGKRGMKVDYTFEDISARVTWDHQSKPYIAKIYHGEGSSEYMFKSLDIIVIFPRPPGKDLVLTVMGARVGKIKPK